MLKELGFQNFEQLILETLPTTLQQEKLYDVGLPKNEIEALNEIREMAEKNLLYRSFIGGGYHGTNTPMVIQRNMLENPQWYTAYTPYQAEISQGRMEMLMNFQVMVADLTGLPVANASLLDEGTAAAEAMSLCFANDRRRGKKKVFFASSNVHPQTLAVLQGRAEPRSDLEVVVGDHNSFDFGLGNDPDSVCCGALIQYPGTDGSIELNMEAAGERIKAAGGMMVVATDLLALTTIKPPGEFGADVVVGNSQRFGVPMGFGGPHAAFFACQEKYIRQIPGRIIGVSKDVDGNPAFRMALQTREQHIRREKATSNICTAQALLANMAAAFAIYHGPKGLIAIASHVHSNARIFAKAITELGYAVSPRPFFDTVRVDFDVTQAAQSEAVISECEARKMNIRRLSPTQISVAFDETTQSGEVESLIEAFAFARAGPRINLPSFEELALQSLLLPSPIEENQLARSSSFLEHPIFNSYHSETDMVRYLRRLAGKDISLTRSMIPLGSCTMKLNSCAEMVPITWRHFAQLHPFAPSWQSAGYRQMFRETERMLAILTGFDRVSLQPNAGSQGELTGLLIIRAYLRDRDGHRDRDICLIPRSAHGTNPASAKMAGMTVKVVACDAHGNVDVEDLRNKCDAYRDRLAAFMITYPSTHGVFEESVRHACELVHEAGGQVYMDGANMNAQCGIISPGDIGADCCHLNLHKTFCIPHGGGGPGVGPICVSKHLAPFLPSHPFLELDIHATGGTKGIKSVAAAPYGSALIIPITYMYLRMMGTQGIRAATLQAVLSANYMAHHLEADYPILYRNANGMTAHEFIIDCNHFKKTANVEAEDVAKRLMDFGFHAPTMSFPVTNTLMIEPTESEPLAELDRYIDALRAIRQEIRDIEEGRSDRHDNPLKNAPHTAEKVTASEWNHPYSREQAAYPVHWVRSNKYWPPVSRVLNAWGDKHLDVYSSVYPIECVPKDQQREYEQQVRLQPTQEVSSVSPSHDLETKD